MKYTGRSSSTSPSLPTPMKVAIPRGARHRTVWVWVFLFPIASNEYSTPPSVNSRMASTGSVFLALTTSVAPNFFAISSFLSKTSTAIIWRAPAILAPWIADPPTPPAPKTATVAPGGILAVVSAAPKPVVTPHPISAIRSSGRSSSIFTTAVSSTIAAWAKPPAPPPIPPINLPFHVVGGSFGRAAGVTAAVDASEVLAAHAPFALSADARAAPNHVIARA